ncbi:MAG: chitobiase/beta-hexosaminidase C-terminal domain-containing protein [Verrucomicrobia bacterium]|nr:chitobiase/beta-hexosaminidase C-terminal domain-containing protein [Verrucomicrobiota bacterium]
MKTNTLTLTCLLAFVFTASAAEWQPVPGNLLTRWTAQVDPAKPAKDAPQPAQFSRQILVPYPVESALSGIKQRVSAKDRLWYQRSFSVPAAWRGGRVLLHFTASDWSTEVIVNGKPVGKHDGGYDPFEFDVTDYLTSSGGQSLVVSVWDPTAEGGQPHGKQTLVKHNIFYTSSSGIWGTVWLEAVPKSYVKGLRVVPDIDAGTLKLTVSADAGTVRVLARDGQTKVGEAGGKAGEEIVLRVPNAKLWTPDTPFLYDLDLTLTDGASKDTVRSYFGMRKILIGPDEMGVTRILLNNKFVFQTGPLDQGWWPDGLYTAPTDEALKYDIETENNGLMTYDRAVSKVKPDVTKALFNGWLPPRNTSPASMFVGTGKVELAAPAAGVGIVYTLDGSDPTAKSTVYQKPIEITRDTVVKVCAVWPGGGLSRIIEFPMLEARPGRQLITNPSFELGVLPWSSNSDSTVLLDSDLEMDNDGVHYTPHEGKKHFRLQGGKDQTINLTQATALPAGDYELSMWVMSRATPDNNLGPNLSLELLDGKQQVVKPADAASPDCLSPKGSYVKWTRRYAGLASGAYTVKFTAGPTDTVRGKQGWVDDFSLTQRTGRMTGAPVPAAEKTLIDYFLPMPITEALSKDVWGAPEVGPRDAKNGLEDITTKKWCYWDGKIIKGDGRQIPSLCQPLGSSPGP